MFGFFKQRKHRKERAAFLYGGVVEQSRLPYFYEALGVPDTVDGRFDMISLHCAILIYRLRQAGEKAVAQALFDRFFKTMDLSLREMGVGDLSVPKHMKRMMKGFNGRVVHYAQAIDEGDNQALQEAMRRNLYGTLADEVIKTENLQIMADYFKEAALMGTLEPKFPALTTKDIKNAA